jgi:signal transduction histidine kinase
MAVTESESANRKGCSLDDGQQAATFLVKAGEGLAQSLDYETTLQTVAHVAVPSLTDLGFVEMVGADGRLRPVASAHVDARKENWLRDLAVSSAFASPPTALRALRTRRPVMVAKVSDRVFSEFAQEERVPLDPCTIDTIHELGPRSGVSMPLISHGRSLGVLSLVRLDGSPPFAPHDLPLIQQLARQCAQALANARLYHEATEAARVREESIATTSHELRTPLSEIKGFVTTLLRSDVEWDSETRTDFLREIDQEADRLEALIGDLLEVSRLANNGHMHFDRGPIQPAVLVRRSLDRVRVRSSNSAVEVDSGLRALPAIWIDARRIEQVIANLVDNAVKYAPGSRIHISGRIADAGANVDVAVEDDGPGIPVDDLDHIFDRFYRGRSQERSEVSGTGLGLAIARMMVEGHGGRIRAENRSGGGARFVLSLPTAATSVGND